MIQCQNCEFFSREPGGQMGFRCDPFTNVKEPECLVKWQILKATELTQKVQRMVSAYESTLEIYKRLGPLQEKMFRHMEREIDDIDESDAWKYVDGDDEPVEPGPDAAEQEEDEDDPGPPWSGGPPG